ncbi:hypothetical protein RUND412_004003 [Rhizina undulata]
MVASPPKSDAPSAPKTADNTSGNIYVSKEDFTLLLFNLQTQLRERNAALKNYNRTVQRADKITGALATGRNMAKDVQSPIACWVSTEVLNEMSDISDAEQDEEFGKLQEKLLARVMKNSTNELEDKQEKSEVMEVIEQLKSHTAAKSRKLKQIQKELYVYPQPAANYPGVRVAPCDNRFSGDMGLYGDNHTHDQKIEMNLPDRMGDTRNITEYESEKSMQIYDENSREQPQDPIFVDIERQKERWEAFQGGNVAKASMEFENLTSNTNGYKTNSFSETNGFKSPGDPASAKPATNSPSESLKNNCGEFRQIFLRGLPRNITYAQLSAHIRCGKLERLRIYADKNCPANAQVIFFYAQDAQKFYNNFKVRPRYIDGHRVFAKLDPYSRLDLFGLRASNVSRVLVCKNVPSHILKAGRKEFEKSLRRYWNPKRGQYMEIENIERVTESGKFQLAITFTNVKTAIRLKTYQLFRNMGAEYGVDPCDVAARV